MMIVVFLVPFLQTRSLVQITLLNISNWITKAAAQKTHYNCESPTLAAANNIAE